MPPAACRLPLPVWGDSEAPLELRWLQRTKVLRIRGRPAQIDLGTLSEPQRRPRSVRPATIRRVHGIVRRALTQGFRWGWISHNPAIDASPPRVPVKDLSPPTAEQLVRLFRLADERDPREVVIEPLPLKRPSNRAMASIKAEVRKMTQRRFTDSSLDAVV